jgi:hypothetical protein
VLFDFPEPDFSIRWVIYPILPVSNLLTSTRLYGITCVLIHGAGLFLPGYYDEV